MATYWYRQLAGPYAVLTLSRSTIFLIIFSYEHYSSVLYLKIHEIFTNTVGGERNFVKNETNSISFLIVFFLNIFLDKFYF